MAHRYRRGHNRAVTGGQGERTTHSLSAWALRLLATLAVALVVCLAWVWIQAFYRSVSVNVQLSFKSFDVPTLNGDQLHVKPLIGHHYFGDFQVPLSYAWDLRHSISPYLRPAPEQYPPFSQVLFVPLSLLNFQLSALTYFALSIVAF